MKNNKEEQMKNLNPEYLHNNTNLSLNVLDNDNFLVKGQQDKEVNERDSRYHHNDTVNNLSLNQSLDEDGSKFNLNI